MTNQKESKDALERLVYAIVDCEKLDADVPLSLARRVVGSQIGAISPDQSRANKDMSSTWRRIERKSRRDPECADFVQDQYARLQKKLGSNHASLPPGIMGVLTKIIGKEIHSAAMPAKIASPASKKQPTKPALLRPHQPAETVKVQSEQAPRHSKKQTPAQDSDSIQKPHHQQVQRPPQQLSPQPLSSQPRERVQQQPTHQSLPPSPPPPPPKQPQQQFQPQQLQPQQYHQHLHHHQTLPTGNNKHIFEEKKTSTPEPISFERLEEVKADCVAEEWQLLRECLYSLQGIDGERIKFYKAPAGHVGLNICESYEGIRIQSSPAMTQSLLYAGHIQQTRLGTGAMDAMRVCGEAGWLYQRIQSYIQQVHGDESKGVVARAFCGTLVNQLRDYHSLLANFESRLLAPNDETSMTLRHLLAELRAPTHRLKVLAMLTDGVAKMSGGYLLSALYRHSMHGDTRHVELVHQLLHAASLPWFEMLYLWTTQGQLSDSHKEFFVVERNSVNDAALWNEKYEVVKARVPVGILDASLILPAFNVGKGINFIRKCLFDTKWVMRLGIKDASPAEDSSKNRGYRFEPTSNGNHKLRQTLTEATTLVHTHILQSLKFNYHMLDHLLGMKQFLFMGQGDFFSSLMDGLHAEFGGPKRGSEIYKHSLLSIVESALRNSNAKYLPAHVVDRLQVELVLDGDTEMDDSEQDEDVIADSRTVWDIFMLDYTVPEPIVAIVHGEAMDKYKSIFSLLFRLKRVEYMLNYTWRQSAVLHHALSTSAEYKGMTLSNSPEYAQAIVLLRNMAITRQAMMHFTVNFKSYLMFEVIEGGWKWLLQEVDIAETLDDLVEAHTHYLKRIARKCLLEVNANKLDENDLSSILQTLLQTVNSFCDLQERVLDQALIQADIAAEKRLQAQHRVNQGQWGFESEQDIVEEKDFFGMANKEILEYVIDSHETFNHTMMTFISTLTEQVNGNPEEAYSEFARDKVTSLGEEVPNSDFGSNKLYQNVDNFDDDLDLQRFLTSQLDHNGFYSVQTKGDFQE